jgi:hypothetical protein
MKTDTATKLFRDLAEKHPHVGDGMAVAGPHHRKPRPKLARTFLSGGCPRPK